MPSPAALKRPRTNCERIGSSGAYSISAAFLVCNVYKASLAWPHTVWLVMTMWSSQGVGVGDGLVDRARAAASPVQQGVANGGQVAGFQVGRVVDGGVDV